jgi:ABC-type branched-subunit amino acid transport system substrate-binding protein
MKWVLLFSLLLSTVEALLPSHKGVTLSSFPQKNFNGTINIAAPISVHWADPFFSYGISMANSWNMFVDWVNYDKGGVKIGDNSYSLSLLYVEDFSNDGYVSQLCELMVAQGDLTAMFGPYSSKLTSACSKITDPKRMLFLAAGTSDTSIFRNTNYFFGTLPSSVQYVM